MQSRLTLTTLTVALATCLVCTEVIVAQGGKEITNSIGMKLVLIPKGTFQMGSPETEGDRDDDETQHEVTISRDYHLGIYQVTQAQYEKVMGETPSFFQGDKIGGDCSSHPVECVSWVDAEKFCRRLSGLPAEHSAGRFYRLPTEAEWEYACRAGSTRAYCFGDDAALLDEYAWFRENSDETHPVGEKRSNAWGLYDMHGNVWEWCWDWYDEYPPNSATDPRGLPGGSIRVCRGGCWNRAAAFCRSASRGWRGPSIRSLIIGFRVALISSGILGPSE